MQKQEMTMAAVLEIVNECAEKILCRDNSMKRPSQICQALKDSISKNIQKKLEDKSGENEKTIEDLRHELDFYKTSSVASDF